jgi:DnaJ-class molecular chaperone
LQRYSSALIFVNLLRLEISYLNIVAIFYGVYKTYHRILRSNNLDDVRDQWERIKLAYEILSDNRMRKRYDRHEVIADPGAAVKRAALDATGNAIKGVGVGLFGAGKGLFELGAKAVKENMNKDKQK